STSSNTCRAAGKASASALPMPTAWLPCPGNTNASDIDAPSEFSAVRHCGRGDVKVGALHPPLQGEGRRSERSERSRGGGGGGSATPPRSPSLREAERPSPCRGG